LVPDFDFCALGSGGWPALGAGAGPGGLATCADIGAVSANKIATAPIRAGHAAKRI